ncbi:hypothetical protein Tco_0783300 [Tanacetum coccineum]
MKPPTFIGCFVHSFPHYTEAKLRRKYIERPKNKRRENIGLDSNKRGMKRKLDPEELSEEIRESSKEFGKLNRAKNKDAVFLKRKNSRIYRDGFFIKVFHQKEDDLVRLQLEALLAEKSRLANDNANLTRENQCLRQLVEYHQLTSQHEEEDVLEEDYESVLKGVCLDFSSPPPSIPEDLAGEEDNGVLELPVTVCLNNRYDEEEC